METCQHCGRSIEAFEPVFLVENQTKIVCRDCHDELRPLCPYCQSALKRRPKARSKCRSCGNFYYDERRQRVLASTILTKEQLAEVRTVQSAGIDSFGTLEALYVRRKQELTERGGTKPSPADVVSSITAEISREREIRQVLDEHLKRSGIWIHEYLSEEARLRQSLGREPTPNETGMALWNELISRAGPGNPQARRQVYLNLAYWQARRGLDSFSSVQQAEVAQLDDWVALGRFVRAVRIVIEAGACNACRNKRRELLHGRRSLPLVEARKLRPLPFRECTSDLFCCSYEPVFEGERA